MAGHPDPVYIEPDSPPSDPKQAAAIIFIHGLGSEGFELQNIGEQFKAAGKLPYLSWCFPTAQENRDAMARAWYLPTPLLPFPSQRPELDDPEDEDGMRRTMKYIESLIGEFEERGIPTNRIVLAGFSQGCAISLFMSFLSEKYAGKLAGACGLCGYLPFAEQMKDLAADAGGVHPTRIFLARGCNDRLVPKRYHNLAIKTMTELGLVKEGDLVAKEYEGMAHSISPAVMRDVAAWLEEVVPPV